MTHLRLHETPKLGVHQTGSSSLGEDEDWLWDVANEMEVEDGVIWVYGVGEDGDLAFTDFGIESLIELKM
jgi:hypothetical protein